VSTCTRKCLTVFAEKQAKFDFVVLDFMKGEHKAPDHLARQPFGVVPALDDDGFALYESRAICRYLDEVLPGVKLTPSTAKERAQMEQWISVEHSNFTPSAMKVIYQVAIKPMFGGTPDEAIIKEGRDGLARPTAVLEKHLSGGSDYLVGNQFTLADIFYLPYIEYLFMGKHGDLITEHKHLAAWWTRCSERKSWRIATGKEQSAA
jgi:glutathione S-transferase